MFSELPWTPPLLDPPWGRVGGGTDSYLVFIRVGRHLGTHNPELEAHLTVTEVLSHSTQLPGVPWVALSLT